MLPDDVLAFVQPFLPSWSRVVGQVGAPCGRRGSLVGRAVVPR